MERGLLGKVNISLIVLRGWVEEKLLSLCDQFLFVKNRKISYLKSTILAFLCYSFSVFDVVQTVIVLTFGGEGRVDAAIRICAFVVCRLVCC